MIFHIFICIAGMTVSCILLCSSSTGRVMKLATTGTSFLFRQILDPFKTLHQEFFSLMFAFLVKSASKEHIKL